MNIKKAIVAIPIALCVIFAIYPILEIIALFIKPEFLLYSDLIFAVIQTVIAGGALGFIIYAKPELDSLGNSFAIWALPISMLNAFCFILNGLGISWIFAIASGLAARFVVAKLPDVGFVSKAASGTAVYVGVFAVLIVLFSFERVKRVYKRLRGFDDE